MFHSLVDRTLFAVLGTLCLILIVGCAPQAKKDESLIVSGKNLERIGLALHNYYATTHRIPTRTVPTASGQPGLSWRVTILPQLDQEELYRQFKLDEPWDSPNNRPLIVKMPAIYHSPRGNAPEGKTNYLAITGPAAHLSDRPRTLAAFRDGTSNTISVVEVDDAHAVEWTRPDDFQWQADNPATGLGWAEDNRFLALLSDSSVQLIPNTVAPAELAGMYTINGGEVPGTIVEYLVKDEFSFGLRQGGRRHHFDLLRKSNKD